MTDLIHAPDWPADRVAEARAVIADAAHHSDRLVTIACEVLTPGGNWSSYPPRAHYD